ncbi:MAG: TRAP transporter small permease [Gammaproteobacteria bacterium]
MDNSKSSGLAARIYRFLLCAETTLLSVLLISMMVIAVTQIVLRNFFDAGILWGESYVRIAVLWLTLIGAMIASRRDKHISIDIVDKALSKKYRVWVKRMVNLFTAGVCSIMAWYSYLFVKIEYEDAGKAFADIPNWVCEAVIPAAFVIIAVRYAIAAVFGFADSGKT